MPGGRAGGGGHSSGGGRIGGGGGRIGGGGRHSSSRPSGGFSGGSGDSSFWQGMLFGSMMSNQRRPSSYQGRPHSTGYNTQQGPFHQQPTFGHTPQQQQYQQATQPYTQQRSGSSGCLTVLIVVALFFLVFALLGSRSSGGVSTSTVNRTKLDAKYVTKTGWYEDTAGWISSTSRLESGLKAFYEKTGVQPYLYVTEDINGDTNPASSTMDAYCEQLYNELFEDEGHLLVVSYDYVGYWYLVGNSAQTVFDSEAQEIFENYMDHYADDLVYNEIGLDEFYSNVFSDTADRIMQVTPNYSMYYLIAIVALIIVLVLFRWWQKVKEQKNKEAAHAEAILNADINDLANDPKLSDLEEKYDDYPTPSATGSSAKPQSETGSYMSYRPGGKVDTYESAREQEMKSPTLQDLEDKYK